MLGALQLLMHAIRQVVLVSSTRVLLFVVYGDYASAGDVVVIDVVIGVALLPLLMPFHPPTLINYDYHHYHDNHHHY